MAYDPVLTSFILTGAVGAVAVVLGASSDWELTDELARATDRWTATWVIRRYANVPAARRRLAREVAILGGHGYVAVHGRWAGGFVVLDGPVALPATADPAVMVDIAFQLG